MDPSSCTEISRCAPVNLGLSLHRCSPVSSTSLYFCALFALRVRPQNLELKGVLAILMNSYEFSLLSELAQVFGSVAPRETLLNDKFFVPWTRVPTVQRSNGPEATAEATVVPSCTEAATSAFPLKEALGVSSQQAGKPW